MLTFLDTCIQERQNQIDSDRHACMSSSAVQEIYLSLESRTMGEEHKRQRGVIYFNDRITPRHINLVNSEE